MVKRKKLNRLLCALCAVFVLVACAAPLLTIGADAVVVGSDRDENGILKEPVIYQMLLPLDVFRSEITGFSFENPMYSVVVKDGVNMPTNIEVPIEESYSDRWSFLIAGLRQAGPNYNVDFAVQSVSARFSNAFSFSNSKPFVADVADVVNFVQNCLYVIQPGYSLTAKIEMKYSYPELIHESGYELTRDYKEFTFEASNFTADPASVYIFRDTSGYDWFGEMLDVLGTKLCIFDQFIVTFEVDSSSEDSPSASFQDLSFPVGSPDNAHTFEEFYNEYPGYRVIVSDTPGSNIFDLTGGLKSAVGGFFATEIVPGMSFGGILSAVIGISLVFVFIKYFGG